MGEDSGRSNDSQTNGDVPCCKCGVPIQPNDFNMCARCLRSEVDITEGLQKHVTITYCPDCESYLQPPGFWIKAQPESQDLLAFCVERLKDFNEARLVDAEFIWTEPHSKRIRVKLKLQKEVLQGAILEQSYIVEFVVHDQLCKPCSGRMMGEDSGMFNVSQTIGNVPCCKCGVPIQPNAVNMCARCLRSEVDITEGLQKHVTITYCPDCESYLQPPRTWIKAQPESKDLLTFCVKRLKSFNKARLVDAEFSWTEPHSKRIQVKLKIQKEVLQGAILEQSYIVEFVVHYQLCEPCSRIQANPDQWVAAVQLRQHVSHRRTFFYLEQVILKHNAASRAILIKQMTQGVDFFFGNRSHALKFVDFVGKVVPTRSRSDKQLVSQDGKSNTYNYKYTFSVEISPVCREDLIFLPQKLSASLGNLGPLVICTKVTNSITLLDPFTLRHCFLDADQYWRASFKPLLTSRQLVEYIVLDVELVSSEVTVGGSKYAMADVQVARLSDFGKNDIMFTVRTHIGHLLKSGDNAFGYDLYGANNNEIELDKYKGFSLPEVILIKKSYEEKRQRKRGKPRPWKLKSLNMEVDDTGRAKDNKEKAISEYERFLEELEENPEDIFNLSLYRNKEYQPSEMASASDDDDFPAIPLEQLAHLQLSDDDDDVGHEGVSMAE
ncbi:unnamed protein product [Cuscuta campestris]|uniref:60S ribosomal export protein NMD3 n=1 Tax=Cuscuta campestris TaxID=132261 RepID=A0A484LD06_9ASTE|nr:unnamed protein product [Cuscuta campestris]